MLIVCPSKYQEINNILLVSEWLGAYINVFFGNIGEITIKFKLSLELFEVKPIVRQMQSDHILVNYSIAPGLY